MVAKNHKGRKNPQKGVLNRGPEKWCGIIKVSDGKPCQSPKKAGLDVCAQHIGHSRDKPLELEAFLPGQKYELPPDMPLNNMEDAIKILGHCINWTHQGKLPTNIANTMTKAIDTFAKLIIAKEKYSPDKIANRVITRERAMEIARNLSAEDAKRIIQERTAQLVVREVQEAELMPKGENADSQALISRAEKDLKALEAAVEREKKELELVCDVEEILADTQEEDNEDE